MNRKELIDELTERFEGNRQVATHALDSVVDVITKSVSAGEKVVITGFGAFERRLRKMGDDAGQYVPEFRPGKELREVVSGARSMRERVTQSLAVVPAAAAGVAQQAGRAAASGLRAAAGKARDLAEAAPTPGSGEKKDEVKRPTTTSTAVKVPAKKQAATKAPAKKQAATKAPAKKQAAASAPAKKQAAASAPAKKTTAEKQAAATTTPAKKSTAKKTAAKKVPAKKQATATPTQTPATGTAADQPPPIS